MRYGMNKRHAVMVIKFVVCSFILLFGLEVAVGTKWPR